MKLEKTGEAKSTLVSPSHNEMWDKHKKEPVWNTGDT